MDNLTAMQKLINELEQLKKDFDNGSNVSTITLTTLDIAITKAQRLIIKEKSQIIESYNEGMDHFVDASEYPNLGNYYYKEKFEKVNNY